MLGVVYGFTIIVIVSISNIVIGYKYPIGVAWANGDEQSSRNNKKSHFFENGRHLRVGAGMGYV